MKKFIPLLILLLGLLAVAGMSSCNSKKKAAEREAAYREEKMRQLDKDKKTFEKTIKADEEATE